MKNGNKKRMEGTVEIERKLLGLNYFIELNREKKRFGKDHGSFGFFFINKKIK